MAFKFKKGEKVFVIKGKYKGKTGVIARVFPKLNKVVVSGVNLVTHFVKPNQAYPNGAVLKLEAPLHASNLMHEDPKAGIPTRIGYRFSDDGKKTKFAKKSKEEIVVV